MSGSHSRKTESFEKMSEISERNLTRIEVATKKKKKPEIFRGIRQNLAALNLPLRKAKEPIFKSKEASDA